MGKTTLALQLLEELAPNGSGAYLSSRVSQRKIHEELPWARFGKKKAASRGFSDLRLGTPETFVSEALKHMTERKRSGPPVIVLDTWDGIANEMEKTERLKAEKMLIAVTDSSKARTIFISEEPEETTMDYLVDGIVELRRKEVHGRVIREIELQKLRGTLIEQHKYLYTLKDGRFTIIPPYIRPRTAGAVRPAVLEEREELVSFGSPDLDRIFGGLRKGATYGIVYDENVPYTAIRLITVAAVVNALNSGRAALDIPLPGTTNMEVADSIRPFVDAGVYSECLAIGTLGAGAKASPPLYPLPDDDPKHAAAMVSELLAKVKARSETKSALLVESVGSFEASFASSPEGLIEGIGLRSGSVRASGTDVLLLLVQHDSPMCSRTLAMTNGYARLLTMDRSVVILSEKPASSAYALNHSEENPLRGKLTLMV